MLPRPNLKSEVSRDVTFHLGELENTPFKS